VLEPQYERINLLYSVLFDYENYFIETKQQQHVKLTCKTLIYNVRKKHADRQCARHNFSGTRLPYEQTMRALEKRPNNKMS